MKQGGFMLAAGRLRSKKKKKKSKKKDGKKIRPTQNTPRNPQQPGNRDHFETACDGTCPTRWPMLARFPIDQIPCLWKSASYSFRNQSKLRIE